MAVVASEDAAKPKGMCIATRCTSVDHFVEMFHRFVDEDSFFVSTNNTRPPGLETSFSVQLTDGTPVLRGLCVVLQAWTNTTSPFKTPGVRLGIKRLTASSMPVFERLLVTRSKPALPRSLSSPSLSPSPPSTAPPPLARKPDSTPTQVLAQTHDLRSTTELDEPRTIVATKPGDGAETRTPGSSYVLPANPLMNLSDESLEGYVDCTLYEETANYFPASDDGSGEDELVPPPKPAVAATPEPEPLFAPRPVSRRSAPVEVVADEPSPESSLPFAVVTTGPVPSMATGPVPTVPAPPPRLVRASVPTPPPMPVVAIPPRSDSASELELEAEAVANDFRREPSIIIERQDVAPDAPDPAPLGSPERESQPAFGFASRDSSPAGEVAVAAVRQVTVRPRRTRYAALAAGAAALSLATIISIRAFGADGEAPAPALAAAGDDTTAEAAAEPAVAVAEPPVRVEPPAGPTPSEPASEPADEVEPRADAENTDPDGDGGVLAAGEGPCRIDVASTPAGSMVHLDGAEVAPSPITIQTTCARHKIDIKHPRYKLLTKAVTPTETEPARVEVTLQRPTHVVSFITQPPGATVFIDGRRAGTTPTTVNMLGFSNLKIEIKKTGYAPVSTRHYSKVAQDKFIAKLRKW